MKRAVLLSLLVALAGCARLPTAERSGVRYATVESPWPEHADCLNRQRGAVVAKEVLRGRSRMVVVAGGSNPISDEAWTTFSPGMFDTKNSDRHTMFARSCFVRSPDAPAACSGESCARVVEMGGHTWIELSKVEAVDCLPRGGACDPAHVAPGKLAVVVTRKCHEMVFEGRAIMLHGPNGEEAIMHATADGTPTTDIALPPGFRLEPVELAAPLVLHPHGGGDACYYNILRDARGQSYHQLRYANGTYPG